MLILSRRVKERIMIGDDIEVWIHRIKPGHVRIGIEAPNHIPIRRGELEPEEVPKVRKRHMENKE